MDIVLNTSETMSLGTNLLSIFWVSVKTYV